MTRRRTAALAATLATLAPSPSRVRWPGRRTGRAEGDPGAAATPAACAIAGSPWTLDATRSSRPWTEFLVAQGAQISASSGSGSYEVEFARNGTVILTSSDISVTTVWDTAVGPSTYTDRYTAGTSTASWAETDETGKNVEFTDWSSDMVWEESRDVRIEDGSANGIGYPFWELTYAADAALECSADELIIRMADSPQPYDLVFRR